MPASSSASRRTTTASATARRPTRWIRSTAWPSSASGKHGPSNSAAAAIARPAQRVGDFLRGQRSAAFGAVLPSYQPGVTPTDLAQPDCASLPDYALAAIREALPAFERQIAGFAMPDAVLTGVETRTSSPVRITRGTRPAEHQHRRAVSGRRRRRLCRRHHVRRRRRHRGRRGGGQADLRPDGAQVLNRPKPRADSSSVRASSAICSPTFDDGCVLAFALQTRRPLATSVIEPLAA